MLCRFILFIGYFLRLALLTEVSWPDSITIASISWSIRPELVKFIFSQAEKDLKDKGVVPADLKFNCLFETGWDDNTSFLIAVKLFETYDPDFFIGPEYTPALALTALYASAVKVPIFGYSTISDELADPKYSTLTITSFPMGPFGVAVANLLHYFDWNNVAIIRNKSDICDDCLSGISSAIAKNNITVTLELRINDVRDIKGALKLVRGAGRIIILCFGYSPITANDFLIEAYNANMVTSDYVYILPYYKTGDYSSWKPWVVNTSLDATIKYKLLAAYQRVLVIRDSTQSAAEVFSNYVDGATPYKLTIAELWLIPNLYDAVYLAGVSLNVSVSRNVDYKNTVLFNPLIQNAKFTGASGVVMFNSNGDRVPDYTISGININDSDVSQIMNMTAIKYDNGSFTFVRNLQ